MKYFKRLKQYKASNVKFDCKTRTAWSYDWWCFYKDGVFNNSFYSSSTCKHQSKMRSLLIELNIEPTLVLNKTKLSLDNIQLAISDEYELVMAEKNKVLNKLNKLKNQNGKRGMAYHRQIMGYGERLRILKEASIKRRLLDTAA